MAAVPPAILAYHRNNNRGTDPSWERFAEHRARVTEVVMEAGAPPQARLAVLGAGNCNDLDLPALAARFAEIHLVDVDAEALRRARDRAAPAVASRLVLHAPMDLTGALDRLASFRRTPPTPAQLGMLPRTSVDQVLGALPAGFDVVLSACLLSQLMHTCYLGLGVKHPSLSLVAHALALAHLRSLAGLLAPGGSAVLVTDTVSTETYALDELWEGRDPVDVLREVDRGDYALSGTSPSYVRRLLTQDVELARALGPPRLATPWRWRFTDAITYLVYAFTFRRVA